MTINKNPAHEYFTNQDTDLSRNQKETDKSVKVIKKLNLGQVKTSTRKFFRMNAEKASKSITNQTN